MSHRKGLHFFVSLEFLLLFLDNKNEAKPDTLPEDPKSSYIPSINIDLYDLARVLDLPKQGAELFVFILKRWNLLLETSFNAVLLHKQ